MKIHKTAARRRGVTLVEAVVALTLIMIVSVAATSLFLGVSEKERIIANTMEHNEHVENVIECYQWANGDLDKLKGALPVAGYTWKSMTAPTCNGKGNIVCTLSSDNSYEVEIVVAATGHSMDVWSVDREATCTEGGSKYRKCSNCDHTESGDIDALGHKWNETTYTFAEDGKACTAVRTCKREGCNKEEKVQIGAEGITSEVTTEPTCTEMGWTTYTAIFDVDWAKPYSEARQDIPELGHTDADNDGNHICDRENCEVVVTTCGDADENNMCDECGASMT